MWYLVLVVCGGVGLGGSNSCSPVVMPFQYANYADCIHTGAANANNSDKTGVQSMRCIKNDVGVTVASSTGQPIRAFTPDGTNDLQNAPKP